MSDVGGGEAYNYGAVTACMNNGICVDKDDCECILTPSLLWQRYPEAQIRGNTGWAGTGELEVC